MQCTHKSREVALKIYEEYSKEITREIFAYHNKVFCMCCVIAIKTIEGKDINFEDTLPINKQEGEYLIKKILDYFKWDVFHIINKYL